MARSRNPDAAGVPDPDLGRVRVLNLVTNHEAQFFRHQVETLEGQDVDTTTLPVPGNNESASVTAGETATRSLLDYVRYVPSVLAEVRKDYDLVHVNYGLSAPPAVLQRRLPVVLTLWGSDLMGEYGWVTRRCAPLADEVIVMSERMAAELDRDPYVIPHGVDLDLFRPRPKRQAQADLGWDRSSKHVLFPYPPKRPVKDYPRAERVVERASDRVAAPVEFHTISGVDHGTMPVYMSAADVMVLTSKREGSPNTVKEALACNLPIVATDVGDVTERLDGVSYSTVASTDDELVDGLVRALEAGERSNGRVHARALGLERMGARIRSVYAAVLTEDGSSP
jgi:glycosyltransferase involved in cell wall biosynthesis